MELPTATRAFFLGMRLVSRRYLAPGKDWVRLALMAASPRAAPRQGLPRPVALLPLRFPADCLTWVDHRAQETRCAALGKTVMSVLVSARCPVRRPAHAVDLIELGHLVQVRLDECLDPGGELAGLGSRCPAASASSMSRPETPWISEITDDSFRCPSSGSFPVRCLSAVRAWVR